MSTSRAIAIPNRVRIVRKEQGLTGRELARRVGIRAQNLCHYEAGKVLPSVLMGQRFAIALGCTVGDLWPLEETLPTWGKSTFEGMAELLEDFDRQLGKAS
jgi:DNA-binding XRE family transcriptional regulator